MSTGIPRPRTASLSLHISTSGGGSSASHSAISSVSPLTSPTNLGRVPLDARVVLSRRRTGFVRYIGKLKNEAGEWYGIALDEAKGDHDGSWLGDRYFECAPSHGVFVRRKEIFYVKEQPNHLKNPPSPVMNDSSEDGTSGSSNGSVVSLDSTELSSPGAGAAASPTLSPLQRTFKSFRRVLQSPMKLGETLMGPVSPLSSSSSPAKAPEVPPTRRTGSRTSLIPPPAIISPKHASSTPSRHQSFAFHPHHDRISTPPSVVTPPIPPAHPHEHPTTAPPSIFDEDVGFASMTRALAEQNNPLPSGLTPLPEVPAMPPQIDTHEPTSPSASRENSPTSSPLRRQSIDRRHSTFAFGTPTVSAATLTAAANAARVVELEKEIVTMRTNHENVVAVLRATNKQHAANVLELRAQVSALADGTNWLQKQLGSKSSQLQELKQSERLADAERESMEAELKARDEKIHELEQEIATLQAKMDSMQSENDSVLVEMQKEFQAKQQRDREQIKRLREDVLSLCNARSALQSELREAHEMSFLF